MNNGTWFFIALTFVLVFMFIIIYNGIVQRKNLVIRSWSDVVAYQRQKTKLLPDLETLTNQYFAHETELLKGITELRSAIARIGAEVVDVPALVELERKTQSILSGFRAVAEDYPELKSADVMRDLMAEMVELEENISAAITIFNRNVESFNSGIEIFPNSIVNGLSTRLAPYPPFTDSVAEAEIEYQFRS